MNFISAFDELSKLYEKKALHEGYTVKYGRGSKGVDFDSLEDAVQHINDGMQKRSQQSYVLYQDGKELIWLDWYTANRDGSDSNWSESRKAAKAPVSFDKKKGKLSVIEEALTEGDDYWRHRPYYDQSQKDRGVIKPYQKPANYQGTQQEWERACRDSEDFNRDLRRNPWESLDAEDTSKAELAEAANKTEVFKAKSLGEKIKVAKQDAAKVRKLDKKACELYDSAETAEDEEKLCGDLGIDSCSGIEIFGKLTRDAGVEWELVEGSLTEAAEPGIEYYMQTLAWDVDTYEDRADMYDDEDNFGPDYTFIGTSEEIIAKLNQIAKTHEFSYINIYQGSDITDNSNCVFNASDVDTATDEEFDKAVVWLNKLIPEDEPFMKQLDISPNGKYAAELTEAVEDEEIEIIDDEPKQTIVECAKCGALVIVDEVEVDEESDLVNVKDECKFCEEKEGYKIIGSVLPYEAPEADEAVEEEIPEEPVEDELAEEDDIIDEDLADVARKVFDKPASTKTQQAWEDELNGEMGEISPKRRKHLERKFAQQRDWEARHTTEVAEDVKAGEAETAVAGVASAGAAETHVAGREELPELPD